MWLTVLEMGIQFLGPFIASLKAGKAPAEVITAVQGALDAVIAHKADVISKLNLDAQRG